MCGLFYCNKIGLEGCNIPLYVSPPPLSNPLCSDENHLTVRRLLRTGINVGVNANRLTRLVIVTLLSAIIA